MALGRFFITGTVLDTASDPDDTELFAAPGTNQAIYIKWILITVVTPKASSSISIEDGAGGTKLIVVGSTADDNPTHYVDFPGEGLKLSKNTALNATIEGATGVVANVSTEIEVKGR